MPSYKCFIHVTYQPLHIIYAVIQVFYTCDIPTFAYNWVITVVVKTRESDTKMINPDRHACTYELTHCLAYCLLFCSS